MRDDPKIVKKRTISVAERQVKILSRNLKRNNRKECQK